MTDTRDRPLVDPMEARHVLWHFRQPGGVEPGNFITRLLDAMAAADPRNLVLLGRGFPGYMLAMDAVLNQEDGFAALQAAAGVTLCPECKGAGLVHRPRVGPGGQIQQLDTCPDCRGRGVVDAQ